METWNVIIHLLTIIITGRSAMGEQKVPASVLKRKIRQFMNDREHILHWPGQDFSPELGKLFDGVMFGETPKDVAVFEALELRDVVVAYRNVLQDAVRIAELVKNPSVTDDKPTLDEQYNKIKSDLASDGIPVFMDE